MSVGLGSRPNLQLTSLTWNINSNNYGGWWAGYGWHRKSI